VQQSVGATAVIVRKGLDSPASGELLTDDGCLGRAAGTWCLDLDLALALNLDLNLDLDW